MKSMSVKIKLVLSFESNNIYNMSLQQQNKPLKGKSIANYLYINCNVINAELKFSCKLSENVIHIEPQVCIFEQIISCNNTIYTDIIKVFSLSY